MNDLRFALKIIKLYSLERNIMFAKIKKAFCFNTIIYQVQTSVFFILNIGASLVECDSLPLAPGRDL